jgi:hypothetical protein
VTPRPNNPTSPTTTTPPVPPTVPQDLPDIQLPPRGGTTATSGGYTGVSEGFIPKGMETSGVRDSSGNIRPFYNLNTNPGEILGGLDDVTRTKITKTLYSRGWYGGLNREGGFGDNDRKAMENLLYYSNVTGLSWDTVLNTIAKAPISGGTGRAQVTSTLDLVEIANRTALSTIGRRLSETESKQFANAYQGVEQGQGSQSAPSADVFFQNRIQQKYGAESEGYKYLSAISNVAKLIEGM